MDFDFDPHELISQAEMNKYKVWRMESDYTFPYLHMNDENSKYGEDLYVFNAKDFANHKQGQKVLSYFYQLCDLMFGEVRSCLSEPEIDLFYDERHFEGMGMSVKFCSDIHLSESQNFEFIMQQAFKKMFEDRFISESSGLFFGREIKKNKFRWGIPKYCSKWPTARGYNTDYSGFMC